MLQEEVAAAVHMQRQVQDQADALLARDQEIIQLRAAAAIADDSHKRLTADLQGQLDEQAQEVDIPDYANPVKVSRVVKAYSVPTL